MKSGSRRGPPKGSEWELLLCRRFSLWLSEGQRSDLFARNTASGGAYTSARKAGRDPGTPGDLMAATDDPRAHAFLHRWTIEAKHWKDLNFMAAVVKSSGDFYAAMKKAEEQAQQADRFFMLVAKQNFQPAICLVPSSCGVAHRLQFAGTIYHLLWRRRVLALQLAHLLETPPNMWLE